MKLTVAQALGTILNIQLVPVRNNEMATVEQWFVIRQPGADQMMDIGLGRADGVTPMTLDQAVWKAVEATSFSDQVHFAVFPLKSGREDYYMAIEREILRQESSPEFADRLMWQMLPAGDPRQLIEALMLQIRECATAIMHPVTFQQNLLRVACLIVSMMQWTSDWLGRLRVQQAAVHANKPEPPKVVEFQSPVVDPKPNPEPVPPLFGVAGLQVVTRPDTAETQAEDRAAEQEEAASAADSERKDSPPKEKRKRNRRKKAKLEPKQCLHEEWEYLGGGDHEYCKKCGAQRQRGSL